MMTRRAPAWEGEPELAAEAAGLRTEQHANGRDREASRRIELVPFDSMAPILTGLSLVRDVLGLGQVSCLYGDPGSGKTFLALSVGLHVAAGEDWLHRRVTRGSVVYLAAEAGRTIFNRVSAWRVHNRDRLAQRKIGRRETGGDVVPFYSVPMQLDLCHSDDDLDELVAAVREACAEAPILIIVDTVARVMAGGNENSPEDMGAVIASADRLRDEFGCHVMLVHHLGKDKGRGARGHSSLNAAVDTSIEVSRDENAKMSTAKIVKQRDGETGAEIPFALKVVTIGENDEGEAVTSCVVEPADEFDLARAAASRKRVELTKAARIALRELESAIEAEGEVPPSTAGAPARTRCVREGAWRQRCYDAGISGGSADAQRVAFKRAFEVLASDDLIGQREPWVWLSA